VSKPFTQKTVKSAGWSVAGSIGAWLIGAGFIVTCLAVAAIAMLSFGNAGSHSFAAKVSSPIVSSVNQAASPATKPVLSPAVNQQQSSRVRASLGALPLAFEANEGQSDPQVKYMARGNGYTLFLTGSDAVFAVHSRVPATSSTPGKFRTHAEPALDRNMDRSMARRAEKTAAIRMQFVDGNANAQIASGSELPGRINYYIGNDRSKWHEGVKQYAAVDYRNVYPGVDLRYHGEQRQLEFDFIVSPAANAAPIDLGFNGTSKITTDAEGNLILSSAAGDVTLHKPVAYQEKNGQRQLVDAAFRTNGRNKVSFALGPYDHSRELVIDPSLSYATYLGGASEDEVFGITHDSSNNIYVTGESDSTSGFPGGNAPTSFGFYAFVTKLSSTGTLDYTTFVGGTSKSSSNPTNDSGLGIAVDSAGAAYVTGITQSTSFPTSSNAPQPHKGDSGGSCANQKNVQGAICTDAFAFKLSASGSLTGGWSTFIGGINDDDGYAIALDNDGNVWVAGDTFSSTFDPNTTATSVLYSDFNNGGTVTPPYDDGFVVEISSAGTAPFMFSTYLGGSRGDQANGIAIDGSNNVYVAGETDSSDFPTHNPYQSGCGSDGQCNANSGSYYYDGFVTKITAGGGSLTYSTYIGGSSDDYAFAIALDSSGDAYITGETTQDDTTTTPAVPYPTTSGAFSTTYNSAATANAFVTEFNPSGSALVYSTFLGGSVQDFGGGIAVDQYDDAYVTGMTGSANFPITSGAVQTQLNGNGQTGQTDAFVTQVLSGGASLGFSTYLGGSGSENANASGSVGVITLDSSNNMWVGGSTNSATANSTTNFPVTSNALEGTYGGNPYDGFVAEISTATSPRFNIAATTPSAVTPGSSGSSTVTLTSLFGYSQSVTLSCSVTGSGSPPPACSASSFSPDQVTPTSSGANSTLTITTTGSSAALYRKSNFVYAMWLPIVGISLIGMRLTSKDSRKRKLLSFLLLGVVMAMLFFLPACGGGSSSGGGGGGGGTPAGSYTVTVTGTDANNLTASTTITLTVN
jgi:hypothetical protein